MRGHPKASVEPLSLNYFTQATMDFEIILDNARSHASFCETVNALPSSKKFSRRNAAGSTKRYKKKSDKDGELGLDNNDLATFGSSNCLQNLYPRRKDAPGENRGMLGRSVSSSYSDLNCVPSQYSSFDKMLKEASSATNSARTNVLRPQRRNSLKGSICAEASESGVLHSLCSNIIESMNEHCS